MRRCLYLLLLVCLLPLTSCGVPLVAESETPTERPTARVLASITPLRAAEAPTATQAPTATTKPTPTPVSTALPVPTSAPPAPSTPTPEPQVTISAASQATTRPNHVIKVDAPAANDLVSSPLDIRGSANFWPFEANLGGSLKDASGNVLAQFPVTVQSPGPPQGGPFSEQVTFTLPATAQDGTLEIFDSSAKDGSILSMTTVKVRLAPAAKPGTALSIDQPGENTLVTLPLHVSVGGLRGDERVFLRLVQNGASVVASEVRAELGYVVASIMGDAAPGPATLQVARPDGQVLAQRPIRIATEDETQLVKVAWTAKDAEDVVLEERRVPRTPRTGTAALDELLWGPDPGSGFSTSLPTSSEVLNYPGRAASWGPRVRLIELTIENGVALANFSPELRAYGGGAARVAMIRKQIETTLRQFPSVKQVVIAIDGQTEGVLQP